MNISRVVIGPFLSCLCCVSPSWASPGDMTLASARIAGTSSNGDSVNPRLSGDGRYVVYQSSATDLLEDDSNRFDDIFVQDRVTGVVTRVNVDSQGGQANRGSANPSISANGRYIAFASRAFNLVDDSSDAQNAFAYDRQTGVTELVSLGSNGEHIFPVRDEPMETAISADGRFVAFASDAANVVPNVGGPVNGSPFNVFLRDRQLGTTELVSVKNSPSQARASARSISMSSDARYIVFAVTEPLPGGGEQTDIYLRDRQLGVTELINIDSNGVRVAGAASPFVSADGRYVTFDAGDVFVRDRQTGTLERVSVSSTGVAGNGRSFRSSISTSGRYVAFASLASNLVAADTNGFADVFLRDRQAGTTVRLNVGPNGQQADQWAMESLDPTISADGRYVAFSTSAANIRPGDINDRADVFVRDVAAASTRLASPAAAISRAAGGVFPDNDISADGRYMVFASSAAMLVPDDTNHTGDIFLRDRRSGVLERQSVNADGEQADDASAFPTISDDGRFVAFFSDATNLVAGDTNAVGDIFVRDRQTGSVQRVNVGLFGAQADRMSVEPHISGDGRYVAFVSDATNLVPNDTNGKRDAFVVDRVTGLTERVSVGAGGVQSSEDSYQPTISADGRYVSFVSSSVNLVPDDADWNRDVFVRDRATGTTERVGADTSGAGGEAIISAISGNGRYVAFLSSVPNLVANDTNGLPDAFVYDRVEHVIERVNLDAAGQQADTGSYFALGISPDGRFVAFGSLSNLIEGGYGRGDDIYIRDREALTTQRVSVGMDGMLADGSSIRPALSNDGAFISFVSAATNLVPGDIDSQDDAFVYERNSGREVRINAGGGSYVDALGRTWAGDSGFNTGSAATSSAPIAGTSEDLLYQSIRWDDTPAPELQYAVTIPNGSYLVRLHFAETNAGAAYTGARVFDVDIESGRRFEDIDVFAQSGGINRALVKSTIVTVADGQLNIVFRHQAKNPIVSAIEILERAPSASAGTTIRTNVGGNAYTDSQGKAWSADAGFNTGAASTSTAPVAGTTDDSLFQSIRWDDTPAPELQYSYVVPNGSYDVKLYFNESNTKTAYAGARVFDVEIEGVRSFDNLDVFAQAGAINTALIKSTTASVTDGRLDIVLRHEVKNPILSAIEIVGR